MYIQFYWILNGVILVMTCNCKTSSIWVHMCSRHDEVNIPEKSLVMSSMLDPSKWDEKYSKFRQLQDGIDRKMDNSSNHEK